MRDIELRAKSAKYYKGPLDGKEVIANALDFPEHFLQGEFRNAHFSVDEVFTVMVDGYHKGCRYIHLRNDEGRDMVSPAAFFNVYEP